jgi:hypothetical protein
VVVSTNEICFLLFQLKLHPFLARLIFSPRLAALDLSETAVPVFSLRMFLLFPTGVLFPKELGVWEASIMTRQLLNT